MAIYDPNSVSDSEYNAAKEFQRIQDQLRREEEERQEARRQAQSVEAFEDLGAIAGDFAWRLSLVDRFREMVYDSRRRFWFLVVGVAAFLAIPEFPELTEDQAAWAEIAAFCSCLAGVWPVLKFILVIVVRVLIYALTILLMFVVGYILLGIASALL